MVWYENGMVWEWYENNLYNPQANFAEYQPNSNDYMKVVMQLLFFNCLHYIWWQIFHNVIYWVLSVCTKCKRVSIHASFVFLTPASWGPTISSVFDPQKPYFSGQDWCVPWLHIPRGQFDMSVHITHSLSVEIIEVFQIEKPSLIPIGQLKCVKKSHYFIMNVLFNITMFAWI